MSTALRSAILLTFTLSFSTTLSAQDQTSPILQKSAPVITAATALGKVRFSSPDGVAQIRVQILSASGGTLFDSSWKDGSVFDLAIDGPDHLLSSGFYRCVVMVSDLEGRVTRKEATIAAQDGQVSIESRPGTDGLTIIGATDNGPRIAMLAHDGTEADLVSTSGDLSFRFGNFLAGKDTQRMRLTAVGDLGIGVDQPQTRLDVNGLIRTSEGIMFPDGTILTTAAGLPGVTMGINKPGSAASAAPARGTQVKPAILPLNVPGALARPTPRPNFAPAYQFVANDTGVTIGTTNPAYRLDVAGTINTTTGYNFNGLSVLRAPSLSLFAGTSGGMSTGGSNSFFGQIAGPSTTIGQQDSFFGTFAGYSNDIGSRNSYFGANAAYWSSGDAHDNSVFGTGAAFSAQNTTASFNSVFGSQAATTLAGSQNTAIGASSGLSLNASSSSTVLGYSADAGPGLTNATAIGAFAKAINANTLVLGSINGVNTATATTSVGIATNTPNQYLTVGGGITIDANSANNGTLTTNSVLAFGTGSSNGISGEAIASQRTSGAGLFGIDFYTQYIKRMTIANNGDVNIVGTLSKAAGSFKIDHPLDPENKYLYHSFVESPDMMNLYNGNATLDEHGEAVVELPDWFEALNQDFRYQLTCLHGFAPVYIDEEIVANRFKIAGGKPGMKVSWQVTGIRHDAYADAHRIQVEESKPAGERGTLLYPIRQH
jgi:hypothetical protein